MDYKVTVYCMAYNHARYIRRTLEGFVSQKTDFAFKVYVHDDASTDETATIVKEYAARYPDLIFPILQTENQYSQNCRIYETYLMDKIETEFVAVCEGDDYWTDENKLQVQYDYMTRHPACSMCVHNTVFVTESGEETAQFSNRGGMDCDYSAEEIIGATGGMLFHTSSFFCRTVYQNNLPEWMRIPCIGDYPMSIWMAMNGTVHYIDRTMSAFRMGAAGSWSNRNRNRFDAVFQRIIAQLSVIDEETNHRYTDAIHKAIGKYYFKICEIKGDLKGLREHPDCRAYFDTFPPLQRIKTLLRFGVKKLRRNKAE